MGIRRRVDLGNLGHHCTIDVKPACRVYDEHVGVSTTRLVQGAAHDRCWFLVRIAAAEQRADLAGQRLELQDRRRPMDVDADQHHFLVVRLDETLGQFRGRRRLAGPLQTGHQQYDRRLCAQIER